MISWRKWVLGVIFEGSGLGFIRILRGILE